MACLGGPLRRLCGVVGATFLGACSVMPTSGPASYDVKSERAYEPDSLPYAVVRITPQAEGVIAEYNPRISGTFPDRRTPKELRFGIGDIVAVSIFEASSGGLFIPPEASVRPGNFIALPNQPVDTKGNISVPYAGRPILGNNKRGLAPFGALIYEPSNNIWIHPHDTIYLYREPQTFVVFGASGTQGLFPFDAWRLSLAEALAKAGGLQDLQADPASVFVYRGETRELAARLGVNCDRFTGPIIPIVYNINLRDPAGYFLTTRFQMRNKDVMFASNNPTVDAAKAMNFFRLTVATANDPISAAVNVYALKFAIAGVPPSVVTGAVTAPVATTR